jgi:hypothetical protein
VKKKLVKRRGALIRHLLRHEGILKTIIEERTDRKTYRGRPGLAYIKQIMKDLGSITYVEMKKKG